MRRTDREQSYEFAIQLMASCTYAVLSTIDTGGKSPYSVPISPVVLDECIYFHCASFGQKLKNIELNPSVCVVCVENAQELPERFTTLYESAIAMGKASMVQEESEKRKALFAIARKYALPNIDNAQGYIDKFIEKTEIVKIPIEQITGKANQLQ